MSGKPGSIKRVKGTRDILPEDVAAWQAVEDTARAVFDLYNFREMRFPVFEKTEVFARSIGETTDIVEKEMYTFTDRGGESLTLRPEGTAPAVRAFVENGLHNKGGVQKYYYTGPMFRAERPQAGRFRQFHQIGAEVFGSDDPAVDAELILMLSDFFTALGVTDITIVLNSLGCAKCRPAFREALREYLDGRRENLCDNCQRRVDRNPLRALDCKAESCKQVAKDAPSIDNYLCDDCSTHFTGVKRLLAELEAPVRLDPRLVRGLDYYTRTAFEVTSGRLGAQDAVAGGGRYDSLVEQFGGPPTPAIGFALGMERLINILGGEAESEDIDVFLVAAGHEAEVAVFELAHRLRAEGFAVDRSFGGGSMKSQMRRADKSGARFAVIIGEAELANSSAILKDLKKGEQKQAPLRQIADLLEQALGESHSHDEE